MDNREIEDIYSDTSLEEAARQASANAEEIDAALDSVTETFEIPTEIPVIEEGIYGYDNEFSPNRTSDSNLRDALKGMEAHNVHFVNPDPYQRQSNGLKTPEYVAHVGFDYLKDLDEYLKELQTQIKEYKTKWQGTETQQGLNERLEELNERIEAKYANYRNGANRDADPEIEGLEEEYLSLLDLQEKELEKVNALVAKINELQEARKRWVNDCKERYRHQIKKRGEIQDQLAAAKKELKQLEIKQYMGDNSQAVKDRIEALKDIIERLERQEREFHGHMGFGTVTVEFDPGMGKHPDFEYRPMNIGKGKTVPKPADPILDDEHELDCWTLNGEPFDFDTPVNENIKLVAKYREKTKGKDPIIEDEETVTVTFDCDNGDELRTFKVKKGEPIDSIGRPDKEGYKFDCWQLDGEPYDFEQPVNEDITLNASYKKLHKVCIYGGKLGRKVSAEENGLFEFEVLDGEPIDFEAIKNSPEFEENHKAQGKKNKILKGWETMDGEEFDINQPIHGDVEINANYKFDWVRVAGGAAGVGLSAGIAAVDQQYLGGTGIANLATGAASVIARGIRATKAFKLKNSDYVPIPTENLTGIEKAKAVVKNYIHSEAHYKRLNTFFTSLGVSSLVAGIAHIAIEEPKKTIDPQPVPPKPEDPTPIIEESPSDPTVHEYFSEKGAPEKIFDSSAESLGGVNPENPLPEFEGAIPGRAYNPENGQWMNIDNNTTMDQVKEALGTDRPQWDFMKNGQSLGWGDEINSYGGISR